MSATPQSVPMVEIPMMSIPRASSSDSIMSAITVDDSNALSSSSTSTPPTSCDTASISSTSMEHENNNTTPAEPSERLSGRARRAPPLVSTYNVKALSGTAIHAPKKFRNQKDDLEARRRRTISGDTLVSALASANSSTETVSKDVNRLVQDGIEALDLQWSVKGLPKSRSQIGLSGSPQKSAKQLDLERRRSTRSTGEQIESFTKKLTGVLGKRSRKTDDVGAGLKKAKRELRNLADTPEFAKIDTKPVVSEVWSNGKLVVAEPPPKKKRLEEPVPENLKEAEVKPLEKKKLGGKREKVWLKKGLYAGQDSQVNYDWFKNDSLDMQKKMKGIAPYQPNVFMPLPMWHGQRLLQVGRDFKLPFDVCNPLPPGQPKPDEWRKTSSNRFVGDAAALWRKSNLFDSFSSKCVCTPEGGCDEDCQNRIMLYECDDTNCGAGRLRCRNRAFADLTDRRRLGGKFRIGVEVIKTADRGYGVRSNRCFAPHQIIVEYTGEIITEEECDRRMNEDYKDNECYYLMSFDQSMIIDATKGSIARFVNHSCKPNCRMVKWIVGGKPRMALFAGDNPIMSGDELTYDYNFDPFSAKNVQECRCGSDNCRGVLGPKPKDVKLAKEVVKDVLQAGKRKLKELLGMDGNDDGDRTPKKRKLKQATGVKRSTSSASMMLMAGAAKTIKKTVSTSLLSVRRTGSTKRIVKKTVKASALQTYGKPRGVSSRNSSLTIVATESNSRSSKDRASSVGKQSPGEGTTRSIQGLRNGSRGASLGTIRVVSGSEEDEE